MARFLFRLDANASIGYGHLSRCSVLTDELARRGHDVWFASYDRIDKTHWFRPGRRFVPIESPCDFELLADGIEPDVVLCDLRDYDPAELARMHCDYALAVFDDYQTRPLPADLLINTQITWRQGLRGTNQRIAGGPEFALVAPESGQYASSAKSGDVLITMGGSDTNNVTAGILEALDRMPESLDVTVVLGPGYRHDADLLPLARAHRVAIERAVPSLAPLFASHTVTIAAVGVTLYELARSGAPAIAVIERAYQTGLAEAFERAGTLLALPLGEALAGRLRVEVGELLNDVQKRERMSMAGRSLLDGQGPKRLADELEALVARSTRMSLSA